MKQKVILVNQQDVGDPKSSLRGHNDEKRIEFTGGQITYKSRKRLIKFKL
jgi:hypothetical protein